LMVAVRDARVTAPSEPVKERRANGYLPVASTRNTQNGAVMGDPWNEVSL
jgi:hypothetical protein